MALKNLHRITCRLLPGSCSCDTSETIGDFDIKKYNEINNIIKDSDDSIVYCPEIKPTKRRIKTKKISADTQASAPSSSQTGCETNKKVEKSLFYLWYRSSLIIMIVYQLLYVASVLILCTLLHSESIGMDVFGEEKEKIVTQTYHSIASTESISWLFQDGSRFKQAADTLVVAWLMTNYTLRIRCMLTFVVAVPVFFLVL